MLSKMSRAIITLICLLFLAGCGSGGSGDTSTSGGASLAKQADQICKQGETQKNSALKKALQGVAANGQGFTRQDEEDLVTEVALPPIEEMVRQLEGLEPTEGTKKQFDSMVAAFQTEVDTLKANPSSVANGTGGEFTGA